MSYISKIYLRRKLLKQETLKCFLALLGVYPILIRIGEMTLSSNSNVLDFLKSDIFFIISFFSSIVLTLILRSPLRKVSDIIASNNTKIEICSGDIFDQKSGIVIPTNTTFDTKLNENIISPESVQGKFEDIYSEKTIENLVSIALSKKNIVGKRASKVEGNENIYDLGTTVHFKIQNKQYFLLAMSSLNEYGISKTSKDDLKKSLDKFWDYLCQEAPFQDEINIPLLGTRSGRSNLSYTEAIILIATSFIRRSHEHKLTNKLRIVIHHENYNEDDLYDIQDYIKIICQSSKIISLI